MLVDPSFVASILYKELRRTAAVSQNFSQYRRKYKHRYGVTAVEAEGPTISKRTRARDEYSPPGSLTELDNAVDLFNWGMLLPDNIYKIRVVTPYYDKVLIVKNDFPYNVRCTQVLISRLPDGYHMWPYWDNVVNIRRDWNTTADRVVPHYSYESWFITAENPPLFSEPNLGTHLTVQCVSIGHGSNAGFTIISTPRDGSPGVEPNMTYEYMKGYAYWEPGPSYQLTDDSPLYEPNTTSPSNNRVGWSILRKESIPADLYFPEWHDPVWVLREQGVIE